jgi:hypothetical protein
MRVIVKALVCAGVSLTVVGCNTVDGVYSREGAGVDLYATEGVSTADAQEAYFAKICDQAGVICAPNSGPATWSAVVRAGMNDIDERCDGYLTWLDNVRRSQAPITKQLADTAAATALIMQATGSNAAAMAVVAAAFGFASNTFTNISSRLILEVPHSTVQAVVLSRQKAYRDDLFGIPPVLIPNRPAAVYALRSYLRLCMPMTIEMEINNTVATFERGGVAALTAGGGPVSSGGSNPKTRFISAKSVGVAPAPIRSVSTPIPVVTPTATGNEPTDPVVIAGIRRALCLPESGGLDDEAHRRLGLYLDSIGTRHSERFFAREMVILNRLIDKNQTAKCSLFG